MSKLVDPPILRHPFSGLVSGSTCSGKTQWTLRLIENAKEMISPPPEKILFCYNEWQESYRPLLMNPAVSMIEGLPCNESLKAGTGKARLLILDDLMIEACQGSDKNGTIAKLFVQGMHHWNISVLFLVQSLFLSPAMRLIRINSHVIVLMRNASDKSQIASLARQLYPRKSQFMIKSYEDATKNKWGYLLVDLSPHTEDNMRLRTSIFPEEIGIVYHMSGR